MLKRARAYVGIAALFLFVVSLPLSTVSPVRNHIASFLKEPLSFSAGISQTVQGLLFFKKTAAENRTLREALARVRFDKLQMEELRLENARLVRLLGLRAATPVSVRRSLFARVIGRSPSAWNKVLLIDKGTREGVRVNMLVLSEMALAGKVIEAGPSVSKVLLLKDPNFKIGVLIQRTRQEGVLFGTASGSCRVKYLSLEVSANPGDWVETAGLGGFFPKGIPVGRVTKVWKEPGQIYQVAEVAPLADSGRIEEVVCVE